MKRRVVITGLGPVTAAGIGKEQFWEGVTAGKSFVDTISYFDAEPFDSHMAAEARDFDVGDYVSVSRRRQCDRFTHFGLAGVKLALEDASIDLENEDRNTVGTFIGNNLGGVGFGEDELFNLYKHGESRVSVYQAIAWFYTATQGQISIENKLYGHSKTFACDRVSAHHAIGDAFRTIQRGRIDVALAGGTEAPLRAYGWVGYLKSGIVSRRNDTPSTAYRPFDARRDGLVIGEGGGILVLEELERAKKRGAHIYAEVVGYGAASAGLHHAKVGTDPRPLTRAMQLALDEGGLDASTVGYINAAAEGTQEVDRLETQAIKNVLGKRAPDVPVSAPKAMYGNIFGGAGAVDLIVNALVHDSGTIPPTINLEVPDPDCDLNYVPNTAVRQDVSVSLMNGIAHGGTTACLATKKFDA